MNEVNAGEQRQTSWTDRQAAGLRWTDNIIVFTATTNQSAKGGRNDSDSEIIRKTTEMSKNNLVASVGTGSILDYSDISWVGEQKEREHRRERERGRAEIEKEREGENR